MFDSRRSQHFGECMDRVAMKAIYPLRFVWHDERALAKFVLRGNPGGTAVRVATLGLDAADGEHKASRAVHPIRADRKYACHIVCAYDLSARAEANLVAQIDANKCIVRSPTNYFVIFACVA